MLLTEQKILVTGGAGFIGSNLIERFLNQDNDVVCLDNFSTGKQENIDPFLNHPRFTFIEGDIRDESTCRKAVEGVDYVFHQAALGSVPRSINDPKTSTEVNIMGFLNMLLAARDAKVKRFIYAASSSTYGDHPGLPKVEDRIGQPLSPYAITKYVNELYANVFASTYGIEVIGLRYFNVFGRKQDAYGAYAAVIPKFVIAMMRGESPVINGDGTHSRDFTYIDNVIQANEKAALATNPDAVNTVYNVACGDNINLNELFNILKEYLSEFDSNIVNIEPIYGPTRQGDVKHSLASIEKGRELLGYDPQFNVKSGLRECVEWYWNNLEKQQEV